MEKVPVLLTSLVPIFAKLPMSCVQTFLFNSHFSASAAAFIAGGNIARESMRESRGFTQLGD